jgi:diguanylate cyclase (GGDEF)-like protein
MHSTGRLDTGWIFLLKRRILWGIFLLLSVFFFVITVVVVALLRESFLDTAQNTTLELGGSIKSSLKTLMMKRSPELIQRTLDEIGGNGKLISTVTLIDKNGRVAYSSDKTLAGKRLDRFREKSCRACHLSASATPSGNAVVTETERGEKVFRSVNVIYNERECHECHLASDRINGKLIIDSPMKAADSFIGTMQMTVFGGGLLSIALIVPFLSIRLNKYITEITGRNFEITVLYSMVDRLSKTIDMDELRLIVVETVKDALSADEVTIALPRPDGKYGAFTMKPDSRVLERVKFSADHPLTGAVEGWMKVALTTPIISEDAKTLYMPVTLDERPLALIVCRKEMLTFPVSLLGLVRVISRHIAMAFENARLYSIAITDELTGLFTPRHFRCCIEGELSRAERAGAEMSLLMADIDNFKRVNDAYGHQVGDTVLREVAHCISEAVRSNDLVFRYGGEEFAVLLPETDLPEAVAVAQRVRKSLEESTFVEADLILRATVSIGVACCRRDEECLTKDIIKKADDALYAAKHSGRNMVVSAR